MNALSEMPLRRRVLVIFNPVAGPRRRQRLEAVLAVLATLGCAVRVLETGRPGDATRHAREAGDGGCDVIAAAGGDGTINEVANGLAASRLPLAVIPLGTANVLAAEIGLGTDPRQVAATIAGGPERLVHAGIANGRRFLMMAGVGFDAHVVAAVGSREKRFLGKGAYVLRSLQLVGRYGFPGLQVTVDGESHLAASVVIAKGHFYAGRYVCAPAASLAAPAFEVCLFLESGPLAALRYGAALLAGRLPGRADMRMVTGRRIAVQGPAGDPVQGDGDILARLPLSVCLAPEPMRLLVPGDAAATVLHAGPALGPRSPAASRRD